MTMAALYLAHDGWDGHMGDWGAGEWIAMAAMMVVLWGLVIGAVVWLVRSLADRDRGRHREPSALELLERRFAMGELSVEEYEERRRILAKGDVGGRS